MWAVCVFRKVLTATTCDVLSRKISTTLTAPAAIPFVVSSAILLDILHLFQSIEILGGRLTHIPSEFNGGTKMDIEFPTL